MVNSRNQRLTLAAFATVVFIGGINFVAVRFSNRELPPFWGAGVRFVAAALLLFALVLAQRLPLPRGRPLLGALAYGVLGFGASYAFGYRALLKVPAGLAAVTLASVPLLTFLLALAQGQERFQWRGLIGGMVALAVGAMAISVAEAGIVMKRFPGSHPVSTNAVAMSVGAVILLAISTISREPRVIPTQSATWAALAYLIVLGSSTSFVLFLFVLKQWAASAVAYQFVLFPLVAVGLPDLDDATLGLHGSRWRESVCPDPARMRLLQ